MIYFIERPDGCIKIGTTIRLSQRFLQLKTEHGPDLSILGVMAGSFLEEAELHRKFADLTSGGEWFIGARQLRNFIGAETDKWDGKDESPSTSIRIFADDATDMKKAATLKGMTIAEYFDDALMPIVRRDLVTEGKKLARGDTPE